jgi:hypothetical protein
LLSSFGCRFFQGPLAGFKGFTFIAVSTTLIDRQMAAEPATRYFRGQLLVAWFGLLFAGLGAVMAEESNRATKDTFNPSSSVRGIVERYCSDCHGKDVQKGSLDLESLSSQDVSAHPQIWEKVVRRLRARQMPPAEKKQPDESTYNATLKDLERSLDETWARQPNPGRIDTFRRLNRTEYQNAIRDLLALEIDAAALLPKDELGHGFDNVGVANLSPMLLDRYISAAQKISRLAVGAASPVGGETIRLRADLTSTKSKSGSRATATRRLRASTKHTSWKCSWIATR